MDVNGVKLYDGDIFIVFGVERGERYKAVCNIGEFYGKPLFEGNVELPLGIINPKEWELRVIGNIHENEELLKDKK
ncbi:YopX family protein [Helicobacter cinaedi]|uniref:YopX family protein n=1 Tax=Helicobacter cinaedi TaxID=213 RepID=UPI001402CC57|nr:YopX family protein [Helicobacter cinaedi]